MQIPEVKPSPPGYDFSAADLQRAALSPERVSAILLHAAQGGYIDPTALLAAILKTQKKANAFYSPIPFGLGLYEVQQIDGTNPLRNFLCIQNVGSGDLMVNFQPNNPVLQSFAADADSQSVLNLLQLQSIRIVAGGSFFPDTAPSNPITLFTLGVATQGIVVVGQ